MKRKLVGLAAVATASALVLVGCSAAPGGAPSTDGKGKTVTLWLVGADTPDPLRNYLKDEFKKETGATLKIEQQDWSDIVTKLTTALPDANNTPDVTEMGNTQSPTFTNVGAFLDISDMYKELGGSDLLQSFVDAGKVDGKNYTLPYYFGSRYMFYRKDVWSAAGVTVPTTLDEFNQDVATIAAKNPKAIKDFSGFYLGGQDWRDGISWIFANGGDIATEKDGKWTATLESDKSLKGLQQLQDLYKNASKAPNDAKDSNQYIYLNDSDVSTNADNSTTPTRRSPPPPSWLRAGRTGPSVTHPPRTARPFARGTTTPSEPSCSRATTASRPRSSPVAPTSASRPRARTPACPRPS